MKVHERCSRCKDVPDVSEVGMCASGKTEADPWPDWALGLERLSRETLCCPDCGTRYKESYDQTHDHWWNDSWTVLTRVPRDD